MLILQTQQVTMVIHIVTKDITLGVGDIYTVRAIYEGGNDISSGGGTLSTDPVPPSFTYTCRFWNDNALSMVEQKLLVVFLMQEVF